MKSSPSAPTHPPECSTSAPSTVAPQTTAEEGNKRLSARAFAAEQSLANVNAIVTCLARAEDLDEQTQRCFEGLAQLIHLILENLSSIVWDWDREMAKIRGEEGSQ
jgi:hypothetical protein